MHPIRNLIAAFEDITSLPVEPDDVRAWIINNGFCDRFIIHYVECDPQAFDGMYVERQGNEFIDRPGVYAEPIFCREIFINARSLEGIRRLAEVKEGLHILDTPAQHTSDMEKINSMISFAATRMKMPTENGGKTDAIALAQALAILFPWSARQILKPKYDAKLISAEEIAKMAVLPIAYVELVMSSAWEENYQILVSVGDLLTSHDTANQVELSNLEAK